MFASGKSASVSAVANYIEDVFSTYLYTGNGSTQTITNGIDLSTKGGLVWIKGRDIATNNLLFDTNRGVNNYLVSDGTNAQANSGSSLSAFNTTGFQVTDLSNFINESPYNYASWTFREQAKFFDVVTYTGDGNTSKTISHSLGSTPGFIIVKAVDLAGQDWRCYHTSLGATNAIRLNNTGGISTSAVWWNNTSPTSTNFTVGADSAVNYSGTTYVAYLFAHNAGGFGLTGSDNVISCESFTTDGSGNFSVNLGYEPQFVMYKATSTTGNWIMLDTMRGMSLASSGDAYLRADLSNAEASSSLISPTATGFQNDPTGFSAGVTYIYIAIRRGPMKVPTDATKVFDVQFEGNVPDSKTPFTRSTTGIVDMAMRSYRPGGVWNGSQVWTRLQDSNYFNGTASTGAEVAGTTGSFAFNNGWINGAATSTVTDQVDWMFRRAPGFFDVVCYTGTGSATAYNHNLGVIPELVIVKSRSTTYDWYVIQQPAGGGTGPEVLLNTTGASLGSVNWSSLATASTFTPYSFFGTPTGASGQTYVAYLFATCPGVSKIGSYTGNAGNTVVVPCGFTSGVRFVLIKRTDSTGDWYVWDSARGIIAGNDPYLLLNSTAAEVTSTDYIDTYSAGFEVTSTAPTGLNATGGTYIFLAIS